jgi:hypothetical protein
VGRTIKNSSTGWKNIGELQDSPSKSFQLLQRCRAKSINAIENGVYVPSTVLALKIATTLDCKVEDLFKLP